MSAAMDFIERLFSPSPDCSDGMFESVLFVLPIIGSVARATWRLRNLDTARSIR